MNRIRILTTAALLGMAATPAIAADATASTDANALGAALTGPGFNLTSASLGGNAEAGTFTNGGAFGIANGVVLTTGGVGCVGNSNSTTECTGGPTGADNSSLLLTFTVDSDSLFFNYVFGSEEYNEYVGSSFNDIFSLILNGPGFSNVNLAVLPGGGVVSINNVNNSSNSAYYNDNSAGGLPFQLDGFTDVLTASATGLTAGAEYTLAFKVQDIGDSVLDSAVFIQGGTIGTVNPSVPEPSTWAMMLLGFGAIGTALRRRRRKLIVATA